MYDINQCSPIWTLRPYDAYNIVISRKLIVCQLMVMYLVYSIIDFVLLRQINKLKLEDKKLNREQIQNLTKQYKCWKEVFMQIFGDHIVSIGFVISFSPYTLEVILCYVYFLLYLFYVTRLFKFEVNSEYTKKLLRMLNLSIMICGMIGISRCGRQDPLGTCLDSKYNHQR